MHCTIAQIRLLCCHGGNPLYTNLNIMPALPSLSPYLALLLYTALLFPALLRSALLCQPCYALPCSALLCSAWLSLAPCSALHRLALLCSAWHRLCSSLPFYAPLCSALPALLRSALLCSFPLGSAWHPAPFGSALLSLALFRPPFHYYSHVPLLHDPLHYIFYALS